MSLTVDTDTGAGYVNDNGQTGFQAEAGTTTGENPVSYDADSAYYALHSFHIKSSAEAITNTIYITNVKATLPETQNSENLNKALRVLVKHNGVDASAKVYSPVYAASSYSAATTAGAFSAATKATVTPINATAANGLIASASQSFLADQAIPANNATPLQIDIYLYFEGEDPNCKSANLTATLDQIQVEVTFSTLVRNS